MVLLILGSSPRQKPWRPRSQWRRRWSLWRLQRGQQLHGPYPCRPWRRIRKQDLVFSRTQKRVDAIFFSLCVGRCPWSKEVARIICMWIHNMSIWFGWWVAAPGALAKVSVFLHVFAVDLFVLIISYSEFQRNCIVQCQDKHKRIRPEMPSSHSGNSGGFCEASMCLIVLIIYVGGFNVLSPFNCKMPDQLPCWQPQLQAVDKVRRLLFLSHQAGRPGLHRFVSRRWGTVIAVLRNKKAACLHT